MAIQESSVRPGRKRRRTGSWGSSPACSPALSSGAPCCWAGSPTRLRRGASKAARARASGQNLTAWFLFACGPDSAPHGESRRKAAVADRDRERLKWGGKRTLRLGAVSARSGPQAGSRHSAALNRILSKARQIGSIGNRSIRVPLTRCFGKIPRRPPMSRYGLRKFLLLQTLSLIVPAAVIDRGYTSNSPIEPRAWSRFGRASPSRCR